MTKKKEKKSKKETASFDPSKLSDEDFAKVFADERLFKHSRFKQLNEKAKQADTYANQEKEREEQELLDQKKHLKVIANQKKEIAELKGSVAQSKIDNAIQSSALKAGVVDAEVALKLIDRAGITVGEDGQIVGIDEAVKSLVGAKPYLIGDNTPPDLGGGSSPPGGGNNKAKFTLSQIQDPIFYRENQKEIQEAIANKQVEVDVDAGTAKG